jgi:hypothetical protein
MTNAFAAAAAALCADPNLSAPALYRPPTEPHFQVRVIRSRSVEPEFGGAGLGAMVREELVDISAAALTITPRRLDTIIFDAEPSVTYRVERVEMDETGAMWRLVLSR